MPIGDPESIELFKGPLYDELHAFYNEWISMVIIYTLSIMNDKSTVNCNSCAILVSINVSLDIRIKTELYILLEWKVLIHIARIIISSFKFLYPSCKMTSQ